MTLFSGDEERQWQGSYTDPGGWWYDRQRGE